MAPLVHSIATETHFVDHLAPVWAALPAEMRGNFFTGKAQSTLKRAQKYGIEAQPTLPPRHRAGAGLQGVGLVCASGDLERFVIGAPRLPMVFLEHGCGLSYSVTQNSYAGSGNRPNVVQFIFPNELSAAKQRMVHTTTPITVVGSSPKLDSWVGKAKPTNAKPIVALSFHWDCTVVPETRSALYWYRKHFADLLELDVEIVGHSHPRVTELAKVAFRTAGIRYISEFDEVLATADLYCVDNSSTLYEFAATGRPVIALNCPRYRREVRHGLRFWDLVPGIQCDDPQSLGATILEALEDPPHARLLREQAIRAVFPQNDGQCAARTAQTILDACERDGQEPLASGPRSARSEWHFQTPNGEVIYLTKYEAGVHAMRFPEQVGTQIVNCNY